METRSTPWAPGIGPGNYFLQPGKKTPKELIADVKEGLYVTEFLGHGANLVTGDYSRGASGLWISGGEPFMRKELAEIVELFYVNNGVRHINLPLRHHLVPYGTRCRRSSVAPVAAGRWCSASWGWAARALPV